MFQDQVASFGTVDRDLWQQQVERERADAELEHAVFTHCS